MQTANKIERNATAEENMTRRSLELRPLASQKNAGAITVAVCMLQRKLKMRVGTDGDRVPATEERRKFHHTDERRRHRQDRTGENEKYHEEEIERSTSASATSYGWNTESKHTAE